MHELGLAQEIVRVADQAAAKVGATRVVSVEVTVGRLMQVEVQSLLFLLGVVRTTLPRTSGASFWATVEPVRVRCQSCLDAWDLEGWTFLCRSCGSAELETLSGDRLEVTNMEVEIEDERGCARERAEGE